MACDELMQKLVTSSTDDEENFLLCNIVLDIYSSRIAARAKTYDIGLRRSV